MIIDRWTTKATAALAVLAGVVVMSSAPASADLGEFSRVGSFKEGQVIEGIATDESTGDVYIYDTTGTILKVDADGKPVDFSGLGGNAITNTGSYGTGETELAVDNSSGPAKGDIYLAGGSGVKIFGANGDKLGEITQVGGRPWGEVACGVAVDGSGNLYVGLYNSGSNAWVSEYSPVSNPVTNEDYEGSHGGLNEICEIAAGPTGEVYASTWNPNKLTPIVEFEGIHSEGAKEIISSSGGTLAVANAPSAELFFSHVAGAFLDISAIAQYDSSGNPLSTFSGGEDESYYTLAIDAKNGRLYTYDHVRGGIEIWQGLVRPGVKAVQASNLSSTGAATLNGRVDPEGLSVESCSFEYGASAAYGSTVPCAQGTPLTGTSPLSVSAAVAELKLNHEYHYRLAVTDSHGTLDSANETFTILVKPTVEDQQPSVSGTTRSTARLTGTINPKEGDTSYRFEYGPSENYGNSTPALRTGESPEALTVSDQLSDLIPDTVYHYRLVAKNVAGLVEGADHTFRTGPSIPPGALTGGAIQVQQNTATITGVVNARDLPTTYGFEIGTSTDYGPPTGLGPVGAGLSEAPVSLALTGLVPGTTYHYRMTATSIDGTTYGADQTFTTSVFTNTFAEPPAPLPFVSIPQVAFPAEAKPVVKKPIKKKARKKAGARSKTKIKSKKKPKTKK